VDYQFWTTTVIGIVGLGLMYWTALLTKRMLPETAAGKSKAKYWPLLIMLLLMFANWIPFIMHRAQASALDRVVEEKKQLSIKVNELDAEVASLQQQRGTPKIVTRTLPAPNFETQIVHSENFTPSDPRWGSGVRVTIATEKTKGPSQLLIIFDDDIGLAPVVGEYASGKQFAVESQKLLESHADVWNVKWRTEWKPNDPVKFEFFSKKQLRAKWAVPISYNSNVQ
jgi:hypothetical protein